MSSHINRAQNALRLGFIGGGVNSAVGQVHFGASQLDGYWRVQSGAFSHRSEVSIQTAECWGIDSGRAYADWREFIDAESARLDAIVVLTPTPLHAEMVVSLLRAGIPVICEKALTCSLAESQLLQETLNCSRGYLAVCFNYSGYPMLRELKERIRMGELGKVQQIHLEMPQEGFIRPPSIAGQSAPPQAWRLKDGDVPMVCLDLGVHLHHLTNFLIDEAPVEVLADVANYSAYHGVVDYFSLLLRFSSGAKGTMMFTKTAIGSRNGMRVRVFGTNGSADWIQAEPDQMTLSFIDGSRLCVDRGSPGHILGDRRYNRMKVGHPAGFIEAFANLYADIASDLTNWLAHKEVKSLYVPGLIDAHESLAFFTAAKQSALDDRWVKVDKLNRG